MNDPLGGLPARPPPPPPEPPAPPPEPPPQLQRLITPPPTPSTKALLLLLGVFFAAQAALGKGDMADGLVLFRLGSLQPAAVLDGDFWRIGSYAFLHIGPVHFLLNAWALWILMRPFEAVFGPALAVGLFAATALVGGAASFGWMLLRGNPLPQAAGASAGIFGFFGAQIVLLLRMRKHMPPRAVRAGLQAMLFNLVLNIGLATMFPVDNAAHAGGLLSGMLFTWLAPLPEEPRQPFRVAASWLLVTAAFALAALEGAAVARAVNPHPRTLRNDRLAVQAPWWLVPLPGHKIEVEGEEPRADRGLGISMQTGLVAQVAREDEPLTLPEGSDSLRVGERTWVRVREEVGGRNRGKVLQLLAGEGKGRLRVEVYCRESEGPECEAQMEPLAEQLAAAVPLNPL